MVLRNCGPKGYPGMAEVGNMPLPPKVLRKGITDMVRISDARMSGTAYGTVVLHTAPEAADGGPLAVVRNGDFIELDVPKRRLHLDISDDELAERMKALAAPAAAARQRLLEALRRPRAAGRPGRRPRLPGRQARRVRARADDPSPTSRGWRVRAARQPLKPDRAPRSRGAQRRSDDSVDRTESLQALPEFSDPARARPALHHRFGHWNEGDTDVSKLKAISRPRRASATISRVGGRRTGYVDVRVAPPPPRDEIVPAVRPGYAWAPGLLGLARPPPRLGERSLGARAPRLRATAAEVGAERRSLALSQRRGWARGDRTATVFPTTTTTIPTTRVDRSAAARQRSEA